MYPRPNRILNNSWRMLAEPDSLPMSAKTQSSDGDQENSAEKPYATEQTVEVPVSLLTFTALMSQGLRIGISHGELIGDGERIANSGWAIGSELSEYLPDKEERQSNPAQFDVDALLRKHAGGAGYDLEDLDLEDEQ